MTVAKLTAYLCICCSILGCATSKLPRIATDKIAATRQTSLPDKNDQSKCVFEGVSASEERQIRNALAVLPRDVQQSINKIVLHDTRTSDFGNDLIGYCTNTMDHIEIHVLRDRLDDAVIWHEAAHAYDYILGMDDDAQWLQIVGDGLGHTDGRLYPSKGVLKRYGAKNWLEDKAVWVEYIYCLHYGQNHPFNNISDINDGRYIEKAKLLLKQGFINKESYEKVMGILNKK